MTSSYDLVVHGATLVDGSGAPRRAADVAVAVGRIAAIADAGDLRPHRAAESVDAAGMCLAPGFIDSHTHSDLALLGDPDAWPKVSQGVTTEIIGNCGWSTVPGGHRFADAFERQGRPIFGHEDVSCTWRDLDGYRSALGRHGTAVNVAALIGHGAVRAAVMGFEDRHATAQELEAMSTLLAKAMRQGAFGLSSGLAYAPGCYAPPSELVELERVVAAHDGIYATHLRDQADGLVASVEEALAVGEGAGVPVLVSHHKTVGPRNFGTVRPVPADRTCAVLPTVDALGQVVANPSPRGRIARDDVTVFDSTGVTFQDLVMARHALDRAREAGVGTDCPL